MFAHELLGSYGDYFDILEKALKKVISGPVHTQE